MNGDFSQGGWPAFISLSEPQNNEAGAFLQAHSDLLERVAGKQSGVSQQLLQGQGFLSYPDCQDIDEESATEAVETYGANSGNTSGLTNIQSAAYQVQNAGGMVSGVGNSSSLKTSINTGVNAATGQNTSIQAKVDPTTGALTYQSCQDVTPGSFINGQLEKVAGSGIDQLNLANSINEVVSALLSQLVSQALHGGLSKVSQKSSGQTQSYIDQLSAEANSPNQYSTDSTSIQGSYGQYVNSADQTAAIYDQILGLFDGVNADFASAQACFNGLASSTSTLVDQGTVQNYLAAIQSTTTTSVAPTEASYMTKSEQAEAVAATATAQASSTANIQDVNGLQDASQTLQNFIANEVPIIQQGLTTAQADLNAATVQTSQFDASAKGYITRCQALGGTVSTMTSGQTTDDTSVGTTASSTVAASSTAAERTSSYDKWTAAESTSSYDKCVASWGEKLSARCGPSTK
jgi:hypothetical protein